MLSVMAAFVEFELALLKERQREGIALAKNVGHPSYKKRGKHNVRPLFSSYSKPDFDQFPEIAYV